MPAVPSNHRSAGRGHQSRRARARRLPSCMACTRATGIVWPSSTRSAGSCCGSGICVGPRVAVAEQLERGVHREVAGRDGVEVVPAHRERHRRAGADPRAVGRDDRRPADPRRVDEHLAAAVLLDERGRGDLGIEALGARRDARASPRPRPPVMPASSIGTNTCTPLAPLVFTAPSRPTSASACRTRCATRDRHREAVALGRVEVEHEMGHVVGTVDAHERRVVLDRALVGEPQQRAAVVAQRVRHLALRRLGPDRAPCAPTRACTSGRSSA